MKTIDRARMGMAAFLDALSSYTTSDGGETPEELIETLQTQNRFRQAEECRRIQGGLRRLISSRYHLRDRIPARVREVAEQQYPPAPEELRPVFEWVHTIHNENNAQRTAWRSAIQSACGGIAPLAPDFFRSFGERIGQRALLLPAGEQQVRLLVPEQLWGQSAVQLEHIEQSDLPAAPVSGILFCVEAERVGETYEFRFTMDTNRDTPLTPERLLQTEGWAEYTVRCTGVTLLLHRYDYMARLAQYGYGGFEKMRCGLSELFCKRTRLGLNGLSSGEARLLGLAQLLAQLDMLPEAPPPSALAPRAEQPMENRAQLMQTAVFLSRECGPSGAQLSALLTEASDCYENEDFDACEKKMNRLGDQIDEMARDGSIRSVTHPVLRLLHEATAEFTDSAPAAARCAAVQDAIEREFAPFLAAHHFEGRFPHYYRLRGDRAEYLSVITDGVTYENGRSEACMSYSVAVGCCRAAHLMGLSAAQVNAPELEPDETPGTRFGRVFSPLQDGGRCIFRFSTDPAQKNAVLQETAEDLLFAAKLALCGLEHRPLPQSYAPHTPEQMRRDRVFARLWSRSMPTGLPVTLLVLVLLMVSSGLPWAAAIGAAWAAGALTALLVTAVRWRVYQRRIWKL